MFMRRSSLGRSFADVFLFFSIVLMVLSFVFSKQLKFDFKNAATSGIEFFKYPLFLA